MSDDTVFVLLHNDWDEPVQAYVHVFGTRELAVEYVAGVRGELCDRYRGKPGTYEIAEQRVIRHRLGS